MVEIDIIYLKTINKNQYGVFGLSGVGYSAERGKLIVGENGYQLME